MKKKCVIVGAGEFYCEYFNNSRNHDEEYIIAADGGFLNIKSAGVMPDLLVGDFDSLLEAPLDLEGNEFPKENIVRFPKEKDDADIMAAIRIGVEKGFQEFHIHGGCGGRFDHTMANIQCLTFLCKNGYRGYLYDKEYIMTVIENDSLTFPENQKGILSFFCMDSFVKVNIANMKYPLHEYPASNAYPIGVSNEFIGKNSSITSSDGAILIMWQHTVFGGSLG